ncbi:hypothetical protein MNV_2170002 [Candidatus Methanoperedens nitroreducens]|uniref:Uncharacterized protein n=1 Tax=Candidatus Methanoperedens nitratireducens TaxID=1392998 RepID=A0A284VP68_9EURY|nr:hypothetical protein MNV_2170002 [Candidatus Methanoperedens nitroreducens]
MGLAEPMLAGYLYGLTATQQFQHDGRLAGEGPAIECSGRLGHSAPPC